MSGSLNTKDTKSTKAYDCFTEAGFPTHAPDVERVGKVVLDASCAVHTKLGPGLLESVYRTAMKHVIASTGVLVETEVKLPMLFRGVQLESGLRLDILVNHCVIVGLKTVEKMNPVYEAQLLTCLRLSKVALDA